MAPDADPVVTRPSRAKSLLLLGATALALALTARLGFWQLDRATQKATLQQQLDTRAQQPPLTAFELARGLEQVPAQLDRQAWLQGQWLHEHTVYLDNRPMAGRVGFIVLTPLLLSDGRAVLVQRGWVPRDARDRTALPVLAQVRGQVEVHGRIQASPSQLYDLGPAGQGRIRQNVALSTFAQEAGLALAPVVLLQVVAGPEADELSRQWPAPAVDIHKHYGYAFQWFALSALIVGLFVWFRFFKPLKQRRSQHEK